VGKKKHDKGYLSQGTKKGNYRLTEHGIAICKSIAMQERNKNIAVEMENDN